MKTIKVKELNLEVEKEETQQGTAFKDIKIPKGWRLLKGWEAMFLWENYRDKSNMDWFVCKPIKPFSVAKFLADSSRAFFYCIRGSGFSDSRLGVRFCRELKGE